MQGLICVAYMPLCFQLARFTAEAASRVYADLGKDIDAGEVPDIASFPPAPATRLFYSLPVRATKHLCVSMLTQMPTSSARLDFYGLPARVATSLPMSGYLIATLALAVKHVKEDCICMRLDSQLRVRDIASIHMLSVAEVISQHSYSCSL